MFNCRLLGTISHKTSSELYHSASAFNVDGLRGGGNAAFLNVLVFSIVQQNPLLDSDSLNREKIYTEY